MTFEILPAIDLRHGRVVRLQQGEFARETTYGRDPVETARAYAAAGAAWLHIVDLDGARGEARQEPAIRAVLAGAVGVRCQVAGGLRTPDAVAAVLAMGAERVVVGRVALADPAFAARLVAEHGQDRIVAA